MKVSIEENFRLEIQNSVFKESESQTVDLRLQAAVLDAIPANIAVIDCNGVIIAVNENWRTFAQANGFSGNDFIGENYITTCESSIGKDSEEALLVGSLLCDIIAAKRDEFAIEYPCHTPNEQRWFRVSAAPIRTHHCIGVVVMHMDITERKKLERQLLRSQRLESIGTLAGGIAHDLNNVLTPIMMSIDLLGMYVEDPDGLEILDMVAKSANRGAEMVKQVMSLAKGVDGQMVDIQIAPTVDHLLQIIGDTFPKNIRVTTQFDKDLWLINADSTQIHQVLLNVCLNARDAMPQGGEIILRIENVNLDAQYAAMTVKADVGPYLMIDIEDNGHGIPEDIIDSIFDPFFTTKEIGKGTGLGLSTSLAIIKNHGGFIRAYSEYGVGSSFRIYLPAVKENGLCSNELSDDELPRGKGETVLVVDDEASIRFITKQTLEAFGYKVLIAADGSEAISVYLSHNDEISVVLTDMMMPNMDGPATIQVLRRLRPDIRIIGASGVTANSKVASSHDVSPNYFLPKPYTAEALLKVMRKILEE